MKTIQLLFFKPCQGCNQKSRQNIEAGEGEVEGYCTVQRAWRLRVEGVPMLLGFWWMLVSFMCHVTSPIPLPGRGERRPRHDSSGQCSHQHPGELGQRSELAAEVQMSTDVSRWDYDGDCMKYTWIIYCLNKRLIIVSSSFFHPFYFLLSVIMTTMMNWKDFISPFFESEN